MGHAQSIEADVSSHAEVVDEGSACDGVRKAWERKWHTCVLHEGRAVFYPLDPSGPADLMGVVWHSRE